MTQCVEGFDRWCQETEIWEITKDRKEKMIEEDEMWYYDYPPVSHFLSTLFRIFPPFNF
jgi:hypothetical protein